MICAISGNPVKQAVICRVSGQVYERRLAEKHIAATGTDPVTGTACSVDDLIEVASPSQVSPQRPTVNSIPALLMNLQDEYDSLALETFSLKKQLVDTQQELSTALYKLDAAVRVVAKLTTERDEAINSLSGLVAQGYGNNGSSINGIKEQMEVEEQQAGVTIENGEHDTSYISILKEAQLNRKSNLKAIRNSAPPLPDSFSKTVSTKQTMTKVTQIVPLNDDCYAWGGAAGKICVQKANSALDAAELVAEWQIPSKSDVLCMCALNGQSLVVGCSNSHIYLYSQNGDGSYSLENDCQLDAQNMFYLAPIPGTEYLIVGSSNVFWLVDATGQMKSLVSFTPKASVSSAAIHPDGSLLALGLTGEVVIYSVCDPAAPIKSLQLPNEAEIVTSVDISMDGFHMITVGSHDSVLLWDLRKDEPAQPILTETPLKKIRKAVYDSSAKNLAIFDSHTVQVYPYRNKAFQDAILEEGSNTAFDLVWAQDCTSMTQCIAMINRRGALHVLTK